MPNKLVDAKSPYLRLHANDPIDWQEWGTETFAKAKHEEKLILLSIGYMSCYWCHVMAEDSFQHEDVGLLLNESYVSIKLDREEFPEVDDTYGAALEALHGSVGWPMTLILTPDLVPIYGATFLPREDRGTMAGFKTVLREVTQAWKHRREDVLQNVTENAEVMRRMIGYSFPPTKAFDIELVIQVLETIVESFSEGAQGWGRGPKFPPHGVHDLLIQASRSPLVPKALRDQCSNVLIKSHEFIVRGGIHDHVRGGFHRYTVDGEWILPHFEKTIQDNAQFMMSLEAAADLAVSDELNDAAAETYVCLARDFEVAGGLLGSGLDAVSLTPTGEEEEGYFYTWTLKEIEDLLDERSPAFIKHFNIRGEGNFRIESTGRLSGFNVLYETDHSPALADEIQTLRDAQLGRARPRLDDKAIVGPNAMVAYYLARGGRIDLGRQMIHSLLKEPLPHYYSNGQPQGIAYLEDFACLALACFESSDAPEDEWSVAGHRLVQKMIEQFREEASGSFFNSSEKHEWLFGRFKLYFDEPTISSNAWALKALMAAGRFDLATRLVNSATGYIERVPSSTAALTAGGLRLLELLGKSTLVKDEVLVDVEVRGADDQGISAEVVFRLPDGFYLSSSQPEQDYLVPTLVEGEGIHVEYPTDWKGTVRIPLMLSKPGEITVRFQVCNERECLAPQVKTFDVRA